MVFPDNYMEVISKFKTIDDVLDYLQNSFDSDFQTFENNYFTINESDRLEPLSLLRNSENLTNAIQTFEENGIIDFISSNQTLSIIPNLLQNNYSQNLHFLVSPLRVLNEQVGVYASLIVLKEDILDENDKNELNKIINYASNIIFSYYQAIQIRILKRKMDNINSKLIHASQIASNGEISSTLSLELQGPLNIMRGNINLLETGIGDFERRLEIIKEQFDKINLISHKLSSFSNIDSKEEFELCDICDIIDEVILLTENQLNTNGISFEKEYEKGKYFIKVIKYQMIQVLLNLIMNSKDAIDESGLIRIGVYPYSNSRISVNISDNGIGIPEEDLDLVFEPFFTSNNDLKKSGLGLFYCRDIIKNHKGKILINSELGRGTTVKLILNISK